MKLTVIMVNTWRNQVALEFENNTMPYSYRTVQIELTPEQILAIKPRKLGENRGKPALEEMGNVWLEP